MTLGVLLAHVAARWAATRTPTCGWAPTESETEMNETISDFETALDTCDMVTDANGRTWILDENECPRCACGDSWVIRGGHYQPEPPFANAHEQQETEMTEHLHYITHTHDAGYGIREKFTCTGDRTAPCHVYPDCDCAFMMTDCTHTPTQHDECWAEGWMKGSDCAEECGPDGEPVRSGTITVTWNGDCVQWEYAKKATA